MHSDLLMLRVACRVVEGATEPTSASSATASANMSSATGATADHEAKRAMATLPSPPPLFSTSMRIPRLVLPTISMSTATNSSAWDARRIPSLRIQRPPPPAGDTAGFMLGLKRQRCATRTANSTSSSSGDEEDNAPPRHKRTRHGDHHHPNNSVRLSPPSAPPPPGVFMDSPLARLVHAQRPPPALPMRSPLGVEGVAVTMTPPLDDKSQTRVPPATFMSFMSARPHEKLSPLESPRASAHSAEPATANAQLRMPSRPQWRAPAAPAPAPAPAPSSAPAIKSPPRAHHASPLPSLASCRHQRANMPPLALATSKPTLVRKSSAPWRQQMPEQDRARTRERILRGLDRQCRGDYAALLRIVTALDEELLHAHTTSKDHYFFQTVALRDRVATLPPPRTAHPDHIHQAPL